MTLDPKDWPAFRKAAHALLDSSLDQLEAARDGRVWTPVPSALSEHINSGLPREGLSADQVRTELEALLPYAVGNTHPRFFGWVHGAGSPSGFLSDITSAAMNVNAGGRLHISPIIEQEVIRWAAEMTGLPESTSGLIVSGTSMATVIAVKVARDQARLSSDSALVGYTSSQTHSCVERAFDLLGLGKDNLRKIRCNADFEIDLHALNAAIEIDIKAGFTPFALIGTAGAVNMGAIDDLEGLADIARAHNLWFHIDGAFGATARIGTHVKDRLTGLSHADSLAFDFHKWLQVNYEAGCVLIRDKAAHRASFSDRPDYLRSSERGLAGGAFWAVDYGPELSRGFRALKIWTHIKHHGLDALASVIDRNIEQAQYLERKIKDAPRLEMLAPVPLNICCFRYRFTPETNDTLNAEIVVKLQESGLAVTSSTLINGHYAIRVNLTNHRTRESDLDMLVDAIMEIGDGLVPST